MPNRKPSQKQQRPQASSRTCEPNTRPRWPSVKSLSREFGQLARQMEKKGISGLYILVADNFTDDTVRPYLRGCMEEYMAKPARLAGALKKGGIHEVLSDMAARCLFEQMHDDRGGEETLAGRHETGDLYLAVQRQGMHYPLVFRVMRCIATMSDFPAVSGFLFTQEQLREAYLQMLGDKTEETVLAELREFHQQNGDVHDTSNPKGLMQQNGTAA